MFISSTAFRRKRVHTATFQPCDGGKGRQLDHMAISARWRSSITSVRSHWGTSVNSDHALVVADFQLSLAGGVRRNLQPRLEVAALGKQPEIATKYQSELRGQLMCRKSGSSIEHSWANIKSAIQKAATAACPRARGRRFNEHFTHQTVSMIEQRRHCAPERKRELTIHLRQSAKRDMNEYWAAKAAAVERATAVGDANLAWRLINEMSGRRRGTATAAFLADAGGTKAFDSDDKAEMMKRHFEQQFNFPPPTEPPPASEALIFRANAPAIETDPPSAQEVRAAIANMKQRKAAGPDNIQPELLRHAPPELADQLTSLVQQIWAEERVPRDWSTSVCVPVHKKGSAAMCSNYRGINLLCVAAKLLEAIIARRIRQFREATFREQQAGFRSGRGTTDHIFTLRQIQQLRSSFNQPTIIALLDLKGAFDSIDRARLWDILLGRGIPPKLVNVLRALYTGQQTVVRVQSSTSTSFQPRTGVWQGGVMSPVLFTFVMERVMEVLDSRCQGDGAHLDQHGNILSLEFADDIALIATEELHLQRMLDVLQTEVGREGLRFAPAKCAVMTSCWGARPAPSISLYGHPVPVVEQCIYLGSVFEGTGQTEADVNRRVQRAAAAFAGMWRVWRSNNISMAVKGRVYEAVVRTTLLYGCESWTLKAAEINRIAVFDNSRLRQIAQVYWRQFRTNQSVQQQIFGPRAIAVGDVRKIIRQRRLRWLGHVARMAANRMPQRAVLAAAQTDWKRPRNHSNTLTWRKEMRDYTSKMCARSLGFKPPPPRAETRGDYSAWFLHVQRLAIERPAWRTITNQLINNEPIRIADDSTVMPVVGSVGTAGAPGVSRYALRPRR